MKRVKVNGHILEIYEGIDELPIVNFQKYNKCILIDSGIGADLTSIGDHIVKLAKLIGSDQETDKRKALTELENMQNNLIMVCSEISPTNMAFTALIHSIDGELVTDLSDSGLKRTFEKINKVKQSQITDMLLDLKKNFSNELETYFPTMFGSDSRQKEAFDLLKNKTYLVLESIVHPEKDDEIEKNLDELDKATMELYKPKNFTGKTSAEIMYDKQFETCCALISQKSSSDAKKMSVLQYYSTLDIIKKQADAEQKAYKKSR